MKISVYTYIGATTLLLLVIMITSAMNFSFGWIFYSAILGQAFVAFLVYKVLVDNYKTDKTFKDLYEDCPVRTENYR
ncbi:MULTISPECIES: hypothetical protein [unclassified Polaribacter]|uniref:hypothetical protein n=1 Tax=unclassified Polaribacter TaxID=196858 RepID=UPI0011BDAAA4|nr:MULTISPECIES: hypothetical protein [unclassified Polaribacter]TXD52143.1 hypothetical protein ES043_09285 [Polaribacter sp. IC063]TXD59997.1 hypothetical protein ES044_08775 [Polaribacter sp. IC066]